MSARSIGGRRRIAIPPWYAALVLSLVETATGVSIKAMLSPSRRRENVRARWIAIKVLDEEVPRASTIAMGEIFGGRDHSTILHALRETPERIRRHEEWREAYRKVRRALERGGSA